MHVFHHVSPCFTMFQQLILDVLNFVPTYSATSSHFFPRQSRSNEQWKSGPTATTHELHVTCLRSHISGEPGKTRGAWGCSVMAMADMAAMSENGVYPQKIAI